MPNNNGPPDNLAWMPTCYLASYEAARAIDPDVASNYVSHTVFGDPLADKMLDDLAGLSSQEQTLLFQSVINEQDTDALADAPDSAREFFDSVETVPDWVDMEAFNPGIRMFHRNSKLILGAFVGGTLVEGFATNISRSFFTTGRLRDQGVRRLRQNNRHMIEIFMPHGLARDGDGWKLSLRVRLVHAQIRRLLRQSEDWDFEELGMPISAAHLGYAITAFSARLLMHMKSLGATYDEEERKSFMAVWRYSGHLMGIPDTILFREEADALHLFHVGMICEPTPGEECTSMAHSLVNSAPLVVGITDPEQRRRLAKYVYGVSRALIGNEMANALSYPPGSTFGVLTAFRLQERYKNLLARLAPQKAENSNFVRFTSLLEASMLDEAGISYRMPDHVYSEESSRW